jgi:beta-lactamase class A
LNALVLGNALSPTSKDRLVDWLIRNKTGDARLRAGLPAGWRVGDKTGAGERGTTNDVGIVWPPERAPFLLSIYLTETPKAVAERNATLAAVGRSIVAALDR